ncbi:MAG: TlpA family protein disulfide reductase [Betaproteobacteria bacterium]|nr:TlpA family protein disulfide reductase [Betaproteobacteria bacterium]
MSIQRRGAQVLLAAVTVAATLLDPALAAEVGARINWPDVKLIDGRVLPSAELNRRVVIVEFWGSDCPFCARQNPQLEKLNRSLQGTQAMVLTFSIDAQAQTAADYVARHGYTFPVALAPARGATLLGVRKGLPELYVIEPGGRVAEKQVGEMFPEDVQALARYAKESK